MTVELRIDIRASGCPNALTLLRKNALTDEWTFVGAPRPRPRRQMGLPLLGTVVFSARNAQPCIQKLRTLAKEFLRARKPISFQCEGHIIDLAEPIRSIKARLCRPGEAEARGFTLEKAFEFLQASTTGHLTRKGSCQIPVCT